MGTNDSCDIKIKFPSNKIKILLGIPHGSFLQVDELSSTPAFFYKLPGNAYRFLKHPETQIYIFVILLSHFILFVGLWTGFNKLRWNIKITITFAVLNYFLFWISLILSSYSLNRNVKFITPILVIIVVTLIPLVLFSWINRNDIKNKIYYNDKLLELVMAFSHGEWALKNLNSIILLSENPPRKWETNSDFLNKLKTRLETFIKMTLPYINEIIEYEKLIDGKNEEVDALGIIVNQSKKTINSAFINISTSNLAEIVDNFQNIRNFIKEIRNNVYINFSSNPTEVINNLVVNYDDLFKQEKITIIKRKRFPQEIPVLIKSHELADIIDNLIQNSIRFLKSTNYKVISIEISKESPKIIITFSNNGEVIPKENWEVIFEQGYSERSSTGQGLYFAKEKLKKYGGNIFVLNSTEEKTIFRMELNEGIIN